jgi:hypothetical protein
MRPKKSIGQEDGPTNCQILLPPNWVPRDAEETVWLEVAEPDSQIGYKGASYKTSLLMK